jgi:hypothetical protein
MTNDINAIRQVLDSIKGVLNGAVVLLLVILMLILMCMGGYLIGMMQDKEENEDG